MEIGKKIRELRMWKGLTQEELADRSELSKGFISQLENDVTSPSIATLVDVLTRLIHRMKARNSAMYFPAVFSFILEMNATK